MSVSKKIPDFLSCFFLHTSFAYCLRTGVIQLTVTFLFAKQGQLDCVSWNCCNSGRQHWMITSDELPTNTKLEHSLSKHYFITWMKWKWMEGEKKTNPKHFAGKKIGITLLCWHAYPPFSLWERDEIAEAGPATSLVL